MNRREFLKWSGLGTVGVGIGSVAYRMGAWWNQPASGAYNVLSASEAEITEAIVDAMFPGEESVPNGLPNGVEAGVVEHLDDYLESIDENTSRLLRLLLHGIDEIAIFADLQLKRFRGRSRQQRAAILKAWDTSTIVFRRKAFRGLKLVLSAGYCDHPDVRAAIGVRHQCGVPA